MPRSKSRLTCPGTKGHENDGTVNWCKHVCCFPNRHTTDPKYKAWRDAVFYRMQQDGIRRRALATHEQWTAIQVYVLSLEPLVSNGRAALWQQDTNSSLHFTVCYDNLLRDIAKKHSTTLACLGVALLLAVPACNGMYSCCYYLLP